MYRHLYQKFLGQNSEKHFFTAHSHHFWPDVTRDAQIQYWDDAARWVDDKWNIIFGQKIPALQRYIAQEIQVDQPDQIVFAANTHQFINRLLSLFPLDKKISILTTEDEFYSFERQISRLEEVHHVDVKRIPTLPYGNFLEKFKTESTKNYDLVFLSHVFFNSGIMHPNLDDLLENISKNSMIVIDGYHAFMAAPIDIKKWQHRIFYLGGSYKYAQGGEGCCFMYVPPGDWKPVDTGWFAATDQLTSTQKKTCPSQVSYAQNAMAFAGATMDYTALYRQLAVFELWDQEQITTVQTHAYIQELQAEFLALLDSNFQNGHLYSRANLLFHDLKKHGHFLAFDLGSSEKVQAEIQRFRTKEIITDGRGTRIRFGFGLSLSRHSLAILVSEMSKGS